MAIILLLNFLLSLSRFSLIEKFFHFADEIFLIFDFAHLHFEFSGVRNSFDILGKMLPEFYHDSFFGLVAVIFQHEV